MIMTKEHKEAWEDNKLKTLKDIENFNELNPTFVKRESIKKEAIKWVKEMQQTLSEGLSIPTAIEIMTSFHNITKSDLIELKGGRASK